MNETVSHTQSWLEIASNWKHDKSQPASRQLTQLTELTEYLENLNRELNQSVSLILS